MPVYRELIVKYRSDFKDAVDGHNKLENSVDQSSKRMTNSVDSAAKQMSSSMSSASKQMQNDLDQLSFRAIMVGQALTYGVTLPIVGMGVAAVHANMQMDSLTRGLNTVMGSSAATSREMERLRDVARLPGLGLAEAYQGSLNLQAVGDSAKEARDTLMAFGNALATIGKGKNELAAVQEQVMQILSKGKVMTEDIRIIRNYVPQISKAMKDAFGTANAEEIAKMGVSGEEFVNRIVKELAKLPKMTGGIRNELENVQDEIFQGLAKIGEDIAPMVIEVAHAVTALVKTFNELPKPIRLTVEAGLGIAALVGPAILVYGQYKQLQLTVGLLNTYLKQNTATAVESATAETKHASATTVDTKAVDANTAAIVRNTAAAQANIAAKNGAVQLGLPFNGDLPPLSPQMRLPNLNVSSNVVKQQNLITEAALEANRKYVDSLRAARTAITAEEIAAAKAAGTLKSVAVSTTATTTASTAMASALTTAGSAAKSAGVALLGVAKTALPIAALTVAISGAVSLIGAMRDHMRGGASAADELAESTDRAAKSLERYQKQLDKRYPSAALERGEGKDALLREIREKQREFDNAARESTRLNELRRKALDVPDIFLAGAMIADYASYKFRAEREKANKYTEQKQKELQAAKDKLKAAGYDLAGNKLAKDAATNELANLTKQVYEFDIAAAKAAAIGDEAGESWAKIQSNYYKKLAENADKAAKDGSFDRKAQDALALEEFRADKFKHNLKRSIDKRERDQAEILAVLDAEVANAKLWGDEYIAAEREAYKAYTDAVFSAYDIDTNTGKLKNSEAMINSLLSAATAEYWTAINEAKKKAAEDWKKKAAESVTAWNDLTAAILEGKRLDAEAAGKTFDAMFIGNESDYWDAYYQAWNAQIEGKSPELVNQLLQNAWKKFSATQADIQKQIDEANRKDIFAGIELIGVNASRRAADLQSKLENEVNPETRMALTVQLADVTELEAYNRAEIELLETRRELDELARKGINITNQADLAQAKYNKTIEDAARASQKLIDEETKRQADAVQQKINDIRREDEERKRAFDAEMDRRRSLVRFTSIDERQRGAIRAGFTASFGLEDFVRPQMNENRPASQQEVTRAIYSLIESQEIGNRQQAELIRLLSDRLGGNPYALLRR